MHVQSFQTLSISIIMLYGIMNRVKDKSHVRTTFRALKGEPIIHFDKMRTVTYNDVIIIRYLLCMITSRQVLTFRKKKLSKSSN